MKKMLAVLLCMGMLISALPRCFADAADPFVFRDGITWGMSEKEVVTREKQPRSLFNRTDDGTLSILQYEGVKVSAHRNSTLTYIFRNGALSSAVYMLNGADKDTEEYIIEAVASKYGEAGAFGYRELIKFCEYMFELFAALGSPGTKDGFDPSIISDGLGLPEETLANLVLPGASWELPDGTLVMCASKPLTQTPVLLYLSPESKSGYDTGGL